MAAVNPPFVIQDQSHSSDIFRRMVRALRIQAGVVSSGDMAVSQNGTPNMSVNVAAGLAVVDGTQDVLHQGSYVCLNDATVNLAIAAADPTNPRIDIVVAKVQDSQYSGATDAWSLAVVTGTPAPSPSAPAAPANATILAQVAVAALATSITNANITDERTFAGSSILPVRFAKLSGALATYDFQGIPSGYSEIELRWYLRDTSASGGTGSVAITVNGDAGANYYNEVQQVKGTAATAPGEALGGTSWGLSAAVGGGSTANTHGVGNFKMPGYAAGGMKAYIAQLMVGFSTPTGDQNIFLYGGWWNSTAAVNRITLTPNTGFDSNSYAELWLIP